MAKIVAKQRAETYPAIKIEGRLDDCCVLTVDVIRKLGAQIRETLVRSGVKEIEPAGEEPNDFALAMTHMVRAINALEDKQTAEPPTEH